MTEGQEIIKPKKVRDSNMELLRLVAMFLVLVVHANFRALPVPGMTHVHNNPSSAFLMFMTEAFSIYAVNLFVLLSGWYGIRFKAKRLGELIFQVLFFGLFAIGVCAIFAPEELQTDVLSRLFILGQNDYWFVKAYIALYLLSPVLNAYIEKASARQFGWVLIGFFAFQFLFDWAYVSTRWLANGYSLPSFIGLYLLARYMRLHPIKLWKLNRWIDLGIYLLVVAFLTIIMFVIKQSAGRGDYLYFYTCPLVILGAMHLLLFFSKFSFHSRVINWLALSAFGAYLTQSSSFIGGRFYDDILLNWFNTEPRCEFIIYSSLLVIAVFFGSILIDKVRIAIWNTGDRLINSIFRNSSAGDIGISPQQ